MRPRTKWVLLIAAALLITPVAAFVIWAMVTDSITSHRLNASVAHWTSVVDSEIPIGASAAQVEAWERRRLGHADTFEPNLSGDPGETAALVVDEIQVVGLTFPCADWDVLVDIKLDSEGRVISREVTTPGACV